MRYSKFLTSIAMLLGAVPMAAAQNRAAATSTRAEQLQVMADFFVPLQMQFSIVREMCDTAFRTNLMADPALPEAEQRLPGVIDRMVKASSARCDVEMRKVLEARQDQVRRDIAVQVSSADLPRLARLFAPSVQEVREFRVLVRPGDTMMQIVGRVGVGPGQEQRLRTAQVAFARTPGGAALVNKVSAYQGTLRPSLEQDQKAFLKIAADAFKVAHREANLYAQQKGLHELYADAPIPRSASPVSRGGDDARPAVKLSGSLLYVYSFLDVRETEFTPKVLDLFDAALTARLKALNVASKILRYNDVKQAEGEFVANNTSAGADTRMIPVAETIDRNLADERAVRARYRLVVFPANFESAGAWRFYEIRFILMDAADGRRMLEYVYKGKHMVMLKNSENAEGRSKKILDAAFGELKAKGFL